MAVNLFRILPNMQVLEVPYGFAFIYMKWATFFSCYIIFNYGVFFRSSDQSLVAQLRGEVEELRRQLRQSVAATADNGPTIFVITPTYARPVQIGR